MYCHLKVLEAKHVFPFLFVKKYILYFFGYKTEFYSFLNSPKYLDLDSSYKMDLDLWDCLGRVKL